MWNFTPRPGHRHAQSRKQLPLTTTWRIFFNSLHFFSDLQGLSHQLIAMELNHIAIGPAQCLIFISCIFKHDPKRQSSWDCSQECKRWENVNEGVVHITRPWCFIFLLAHSTDGMRMEEWSGRAESQTASDRKPEMGSSTFCWEPQEMQSIIDNS